MQHDFILLDRSQSMADAGKWPEAVKAINLYVKKLADDDVDTGVTLAAFDKYNGEFDYRVIRDRITPKTWRPVDDTDASPRGWTPLNDAIGRMVSQARAAAYDKVAIIIVTDGEENSSKELTVAEAKAQLDDCRKRGWQVIFLGADYDNVAQAASYGTKASSTVQPTVENLAEAMSATASMRTRYGLTGQAMEYDEDTRQRMRRGG